jgi:hypothetical protein
VVSTKYHSSSWLLRAPLAAGQPIPIKARWKQNTQTSFVKTLLPSSNEHSPKSEKKNPSESFKLQPKKRVYKTDSKPLSSRECNQRWKNPASFTSQCRRKPSAAGAEEEN